MGRAQAAFRVLVTRARSQASDLVARLDDLGAESYEFPVIETKLPDSDGNVQAIRDALTRAEEYDWVILTSVNGVEYFFRWLEMEAVDIRRFHRAKFAAVGPKTAQELALRGIQADLLPESYQAEGLLEKLDGLVTPGQRALLPRGDLGRELLPKKLRELGVEAVDIDVYETVLMAPKDMWIAEMLANKEIHVITFTSSSTVVNLLEALRLNGIEDPVAALQGIEIACIGPVTAETAEKHGIKVTVVPQHSTIDGMVEALAQRHRIKRGD